MIPIRWLLYVAMAAGLAGLSVVAFGLYNVAARSGHWPLTAVVLHTTFDNSVELRAPPQAAVPPLEDPALVRLGAGHFAVACAQCHGAPGVLRPATARSMVPEPPPIAEAIEGWEPQHLFWIAYNGVKMSGMPAWPAPRPEEVWPVVAFLEAVRDMEPAVYTSLVAPDEAPEGGPAALEACTSCHGADGVGEAAPHVPRLDIQEAGYLATSLAAYRAGQRESGIMEEVASHLGEDDIEALAGYFGSLEPQALEAPRSEADLVDTGAALAAASTADPDVPACRACHGPGASQGAPAPALAGQHRAYLERQLALWREGLRGGGPRANVMHKVAATLSEADAAALAAYYAALPAAKGVTAR